MATTNIIILSPFILNVTPPNPTPFVVSGFTVRGGVGNIGTGLQTALFIPSSPTNNTPGGATGNYVFVG